MMHLKRFAFNRTLALLTVFSSSILIGTAQQTAPTTFQIKISLPVPKIHVGEETIVRMTTVNTTDHIVYAAKEYDVEILNQRGRTLGLAQWE